MPLEHSKRSFIEYLRKRKPLIVTILLAALGLIASFLTRLTPDQPALQIEYEDLAQFRAKCDDLLKNRSGAILVMNLHNGLVLAAANPKLGLQTSCSPGSVFKIITAACLLQNGISPNERLHCSGEIQLGESVYRCWLREGHGEQNLIQALANSCNIYFYQMSLNLNADDLKKCAERFGLGACTGINFASEDCGQLPEKISTMENVRFVAGQTRALAVTPLQILQVVAALANGGSFYRPFYPRSDDELARFRLERSGTIDVGRARSSIMEGMRQSVAYGTSHAAALRELNIAGKTGTSMQYFGMKTNAWFAGFAPFENPEIAVVVFLENGRGAIDAAPLAREVMEAYFGGKT